MSDSANSTAKKRKRKQDKDGVYQRRDRKGSYYISWIDAQGKRRRRKVHALNHEQALQARREELSKVDEEKRTGRRQIEPSEDDFEKACSIFLKKQKAKLSEKAYKRAEAICRVHLIPYFKGKLSIINYEMVDNYLTKRLSDKSKVDKERNVSQETILKEFSLLKQLLSECVKRKLIPFNPAREIEFKAEKVERVRYLQPDELKKVLEACPSWLREIVLLASLTGMRRGEILSMRWVDLDLDNRRIVLPSLMTKSKRLRVVYLNDKALQLLSSRSEAQPKSNPTDRVFNEDADYVTQQFRVACESVEIEDFRFHDLRHSAASWMRMSGADIHTVAEIMGHSDLRMAKRYQHLSPEFLLKAVSGLDRAFQVIDSSLIDSPSSVPVKAEAIESNPSEMIN